MKLLILDSVYPQAMNSTPLDYGKTYRDWIAALRNFRPGSSFDLVDSLENIGLETALIVPTFAPAQRQYSHEVLNWSKHPSSALLRFWQPILRTGSVARSLFVHSISFKVLLEQVKNFRPDWIFVADLNLLSPKMSAALSKEAKNGLVGQIASPLPPRSWLRNYKHVFSAMPKILEQLDSFGIPSSYLALAFDAEPHRDKQLEWSRRDLQVSFVGSLGRHHRNTLEILRVLNSSGIEVSVFTPNRSALSRVGLGALYAGSAFGIDMLQVLGRTKFLLNRHATFSGPYSDNMRLYEGTGMGAVVFTEESRNLSQLFDTDEIVSYSDARDLVLKIRDLQANDVEAAKIAIRGQMATALRHSYESRAIEISNVLHQIVGKKL